MGFSIFWFRRDLRLEDNTALHNALLSGQNILALFIFDEQILNELPQDDPRISFIYERLRLINKELEKYNSSLLVLKGNPHKVWQKLINEYDISAVYLNKDYEPYALERDAIIKTLLTERGIKLYAFKDQVIFEENDILKKDGKPYTIFTPYKNKWLENFKPIDVIFLCSTNDLI